MVPRPEPDIFLRVGVRLGGPYNNSGSSDGEAGGKAASRSISGGSFLIWMVSRRSFALSFDVLRLQGIDFRLLDLDTDGTGVNTTSRGGVKRS